MSFYINAKKVISRTTFEKAIKDILINNRDKVLIQNVGVEWINPFLKEKDLDNYSKTLMRSESSIFMEKNKNAKKQ